MANLFNGEYYGRVLAFFGRFAAVLDPKTMGEMDEAMEGDPSLAALAVRAYKLLIAGRVSKSDVEKLLKHPEVVEAMFATMRAAPSFRLIHGWFTPLVEVLEMARAYPEVSGIAIDAALREFSESGLAGRYEAELPRNEFLHTAVCVYRESVPATLAYARDRMRDAFGDKFRQYQPVYRADLAKRVRLADNATDHPHNTVRIEVVGLADKWDAKRGVVARGVHGRAAHAAVIYAAAQNPTWVSRMNGETVPGAIVGGYCLDEYGGGAWEHSPYVAFFDGCAHLNIHERNTRSGCVAVPLHRQ
ncbi:MAG: hypothetical protein PHT12_00205 [Patescibacteria group bacterium]|nr:hypothetical protein [Patescibacteria group bacterium]